MDKVGKYIRNNLAVALLALLLVVGLIVVAITLILPKKSNEQINKDQIKIQKGDQVVTINKNGLVEYRSNERVFFETWDSTQIANFFTILQEKAKQYLSKNKSTQICPEGYLVSLYVDGKLVGVCLDPGDQDLNDVYQRFDEGNPDVNLDEYFEDYIGNDNSGGQGTNLTPTQAVSVSSPTPTYFYTSGGNSATNYPPIGAGCEVWSKDLQKKAIISNTLCTILPTPTP